MTEGRPQVLLKLAISADGKAGAAGRRAVAITCEAARDRVHLLRNEEATLEGMRDAARNAASTTKYFSAPTITAASFWPPPVALGAALEAFSMLAA